MDEYHLYLDESETHDNGQNRVFALCGVVLKSTDIPIVQHALDNLKRSIWTHHPDPTSIVLHEKDVQKAANRMTRISEVKQDFQLFRSERNTNALYCGLGHIFTNLDIPVLGTCLKQVEIARHYGQISNNDYLVSMQLILENFCQFLERKNGHGHVYVEYQSDSRARELRMQYNQIRALGTMFVSPYAMQERLGYISFPKKHENIAGLQLADFVPNHFARKTIGKRQHPYNIYQPLRRNRYDGGIGKFDRFGVKVIP